MFNFLVFFASYEARSMAWLMIFRLYLLSGRGQIYLVGYLTYVTKQIRFQL